LLRDSEEGAELLYGFQDIAKLVIWMVSGKQTSASRDGFDLVSENRKARHDFFVEETLEAGLALVGTEVKSLRGHRVNLRDSYARIRAGEAFLHGVHIGAYAPAGSFGHPETRPRKLLMHRREINRLWGRVRERGYSLVPLRIYFKDGRAKVEIALARGKRQYDKREAIARKSNRREIERTLKGRNR
jgi:SsrA-binding protein